MNDNRPPGYLENGKPFYRISGIGGCPKQLLACFDESLTPDKRYAGMNKAAESGHDFENEVLAHLEDLGCTFEVFEGKQEVVELKCLKATLRGHTDGRINIPHPDSSDIPKHWGRFSSTNPTKDNEEKLGVITQELRPQLLFEAKEMNEEKYKKFLAQGIAAYPGYCLQLALYLRGTGLPGALYAVGLRTRRNLDPWHGLILTYIPADHPALPKWGTVIKKVSRLEKARLKGLPLDCEGDEFCKYKALCTVKPSGKPMIKPMERKMPELADLVANERALNAELKAADKAHKAASSKLKKAIVKDVKLGKNQPLKVEAGEWKINRFYVERFDSAKAKAKYPDLEGDEYLSAGPQVRISGGPKKKKG